MIVYNLKTFNTDRTIPYANCLYRLGKLSGKHCQKVTNRELEKSKKKLYWFQTNREY